MKLSISTLGCPEWSFEKVISEYKKLGVQGIEVRGIGGVMDFSQIPEFFDENIESTKRIVKENNLKFVCFGASSSFHDKEKHEKNIADAKITIDCAQKAGAPMIRVFGNNISPEDPEVSINNIIEGLSAVCEYAETRGIIACLEIHGDVNTAESLSKITNAVKKYRSFGIIWDVCHTFTSCGNNIDAVYEVIKPYVKHVHLKDAVKENGKTKIRTLGEGNINIEGIVKRLLDDGYDGYFSFEHEKVWHKELPEPEEEFPKFIKYMKEIKV